MLGSIAASMVVFVFVVGIVAAYMTIVHKFLRSTEEPGDFEQPKESARPAKQREAHHHGTPRLAH
jgi:hypothetical protein